MDYKLYKIVGNKFVAAVPLVNPEEVVTGEAVEFHYWDKDLDADIMKTSIKGTAYALFYLDGDKLMLDTGPLPPAELMPPATALRAKMSAPLRLPKTSPTLSSATPLEISRATEKDASV